MNTFEARSICEAIAAGHGCRACAAEWSPYPKVGLGGRTLVHREGCEYQAYLDTDHTDWFDASSVSASDTEIQAAIDDWDALIASRNNHPSRKVAR